MSCPTCDHTMHVCCRIGQEGPRVLHCPRCGTQIIEFQMPIVTVPTLVDRCRDFVATGARGTLASAVFDIVKGIMHRCGILESIWRQEDRPS